MHDHLKSLTPIIEDLRACPDSVLLVAGGKPALFDTSLRDNARIEFWHSTEHSAKQSSRAVPDRVRAIVINRFLDHSLSNNLNNEAKRLGIRMHRQPLGPGTIVDLIKEAGLTGEGPILVSEPTVRAPHGAVKAFLASHAAMDAENALREIDRLYALAVEQGLPSTKASISQAYYEARRRYVAQQAMVSTFSRMADPLPIPTPGPEPTPEPFPSPLPEPPQPSPTVPQPLPPTSATSTSVAEVVSLIDDALHTLENAATGLYLVKEAILQIEPRLAESEAIAARLAKIRELAGI